MDKQKLRKILAKNMKILRNVKSISQEEFAFRCSVDRSYISRVERHKINISIDSIQRIADAFEIPYSQLLSEEITLEFK